MIANGDFVDPEFPLRALHHDFRFEPKPVRANRDALEKIGAENFVTGLHVREVEIAEHVRDQGQPLVDHRVPEQQDARLLAGHVTGSEYGVGMPVQKRPEEPRIFRWIVFQVGVLD